MSRVSIIIATHNRPGLLSRAVQSARESGRDVEIIVVDDASSSETAHVCKGLSGIKYLRLERNQGLGGARNVGLLASQSEYVSFLDDDDVRLAGSLDRQIQILDENPAAGLVYGQALFENNDRHKHDRYPTEVYQGDVFWKLLTRNFMPCASVVFRRSCLSRIGVLDDAILGIEDWDLWVRIAELYPVLSVEAPVIIWRQSHPGSGQLTSRADHIVALCNRQFHRWMQLPRTLQAPHETRKAVRKAFSQNMVEHLTWQSWQALRRAKLGQFMRNVAVIPQFHPLSVPRLIGHRIFKASPPGNHESLTPLAFNPERVIRERKV